MRLAVIGGGGHVGLPLSLLLAERGCEVTIVDTDASKIEKIQSGCFPFTEAGGTELLQRCLERFPERLMFSTDYLQVKTSDVVLLTIGTPVDEHLNPKLSEVEACINALTPCMQSGQTLILRSTLFPGTSSRIASMLLDAGLDIGVSFCPERIAQGKALEELLKLPQLISGSDSKALAHARQVFGLLNVDLIELDLLEAELAKLFLNASRYVLFATANQFYQIASSKGLDYSKILAAIRHKYPRASALPAAGFSAGPCLFKDTMQLAAYCRHSFSLGHAAMLVNETMPDCLVAEVKARTSVRGCADLAGMKCGILGMAFKPDNDDFRESLAFKLRRLLQWDGAVVYCSDVYIHREGFVPAEQLLALSDVIFIGCPHQEYKALTFPAGKEIIDCWSFLQKPALVLTNPGSPSCASAQTGSLALIGEGTELHLGVATALSERFRVVALHAGGRFRPALFRDWPSWEDVDPCDQAGMGALLGRQGVEAMVVCLQREATSATNLYGTLRRSYELAIAIVDTCLSRWRAGQLHCLCVVAPSDHPIVPLAEAAAAQGLNVSCCSTEEEAVDVAKSVLRALANQEKDVTAQCMIQVCSHVQCVAEASEQPRG